MLKMRLLLEHDQEVYTFSSLWRGLKGLHQVYKVVDTLSKRS